VFGKQNMVIQFFIWLKRANRTEPFRPLFGLRVSVVWFKSLTKHFIEHIVDSHGRVRHARTCLPME
jgi:hypothetical protein